MEIDSHRYFEMPRGLIAVWGKEAVPFLDGMITNDVKTFEDGDEMLAAFPNAQGRLIAVVRVLREGDRFLIETEQATRDKVFQNLFRFTFAGDFFAADLSDKYRYIAIMKAEPPASAGGIKFATGRMPGYFVPLGSADEIPRDLAEISPELYETIRIEHGVPKYGVDVDETTIVPELGLDEMISYKKGCYIGQEIIARIHFRGHVAKRLTGLTLEAETRTVGSVSRGSDLTSLDGKPAGRITSVTYSATLGRTIALAFVRYEYLAFGTELRVGDASATVTDLPFVK